MVLGAVSPLMDYFILHPTVSVSEWLKNRVGMLSQSNFESFWHSINPWAGFGPTALTTGIRIVFSTYISHCINTFDACALEHIYNDLTFIISLIPTLSNKIQAPGIQGLSNGPEKAMNTWTCGHGGILTWFWHNHRKYQAWRSLFNFLVWENLRTSMPAFSSFSVQLKLMSDSKFLTTLSCHTINGYLRTQDWKNPWHQGAGSSVRERAWCLRQSGCAVKYSWPHWPQSLTWYRWQMLCGQV